MLCRAQQKKLLSVANAYFIRETLLEKFKNSKVTEQFWFEIKKSIFDASIDEIISFDTKME